jgi:hypothetical protein
LKVLYLLAVTVAAFAVPSVEATRPARWLVIPGLLALQVIVLWRCGIRVREVWRSTWRLKWLFMFLIACYAFLPADDRGGDEEWTRVPVPLTTWAMAVNVGGLTHAVLMCLQILTVILASAVVRLTGPGTDLVNGLRTLRFPTLFVHALDQTLGLLGGLRQPGAGTGGGTRGRPRPEDDPAGPKPTAPGFFTVLRRLLRGDVGFFNQAIRSNMDRAREQVQRESKGSLDERLAHDVAVITGVGLVMVSLKMLKFLPGVPFAPGFKTLLLYPLYILASRLTRSRWGGTVAGAVMGVIGFLQGDGRFGILEVLKHVAPGLLIDLLMPVVKRLPQRAVVYCGLGFLAAITRTATEWLVVLLLGARAEVYLFPAAKLVPNLVAGTLSGFITAFVLRAFLAPGGEEKPTAPTSSAGDRIGSGIPPDTGPRPDLVVTGQADAPDAGEGLKEGP